MSYLHLLHDKMPLNLRPKILTLLCVLFHKSRVKYIDLILC